MNLINLKKYKFILYYIILFVILFIIYKLLNLYIKYKTFQTSFKISSQNNLFCTKFEQPCDIIINDILNVPTNINNVYNVQISRFCIDLISRILAIYLPPKIGSLNVHPNMTLLETLIYPDKKYPVMGYVSKDNNNNIWIVFRGSLDKIDITQDFIYKQTDLIVPFSNSKIMCHQGFINVYNTFQKQIIDSVNKNNPNKIIITGHSLGAGIATIAAYHLSTINKNVYVYTFASPRVGNIEFANYINKNTKCFYRIVNLSDLIPTLPISVMPNMNDVNQPFIYMHSGKMIFFDQNWKSIENNHMIYNYRHYIDSDTRK
jgi:triacylglycerol lipase